MNVPLPAPRSSWPSRLVQLAIILVVAAVAAATFVLSYAGVHAIALRYGVPTDLARVYPGIFDAVLVIGCLAVPALRGARWWTRCYMWLAIILVVAILGAMDAIHAMNVVLPRRATEGVVAVLPWALLLLAFSLWLVVLRHFRAQQPSLPAGAAAPGEPAVPTQPAPRALPAAEVAEPVEAEGKPAAVASLSETAHPAEPAQPGEGEYGEAVPPGEVAQPGEAGQPEGPLASDEPSVTPAAPNGADGPDEAEDDREAEVPSITNASGPRLRRVRSLPAPPVDDE